MPQTKVPDVDLKTGPQPVQPECSVYLTTKKWFITKPVENQFELVKQPVEIVT
jgi:hypothetical protein